MFGQIFASPSLGERRERSRRPTGRERRKVWASIDLFGLLDRKSDRVFASASTPRLVKTGRLGILLYLAGIALVATITIGVFFGVGLYSLEHPSGGIIAAPVAPHQEDAAPILAASETPPSAGLADDASKSAKTISPPSAEPSAPAPAEPPVAKHSEPNRFARATSETVSGVVIEVPDAMTWVVVDRAVQLWGVRPGPPSLAPLLLRFVDGVRAKGPVACHKHAHSSRYQCLTATGDDIAEAAILVGLGRAANRATHAYRNAEAQARQKGRGLWAKL